MLRISARTGPLEGASGMCMVYSPMFRLIGFSLRSGWYSSRSFSVMIPPGTARGVTWALWYWLVREVMETCSLDVLHHALSHGACVEHVGTLLGDSLVRLGQLWESDDIVFLQDVPLRVAEHGAGGGQERRNREPALSQKSTMTIQLSRSLGCSQGRLLFSPQVFISLDGLFAPVDSASQGSSYRDAVPGQSDAGLKQLLPRQPAVPLVGQLVTTELPGYGYRQSTCPMETQERVAIEPSTFFL